MNSYQLRESFLKFFVKRGHKIIPSATLVPATEVDLIGGTRVLFTTAGMHPLIPYLTGRPHPQGKRLANVQKCLRTDDIDEVGDAVHNTFFEMLGNWSLGDYGKREAISWSWQFLTQVLKLPKSKIYVSIFGGDGNIPKDAQSEKIWQSLDLPDNHIFAYGKKENWWGPVGATGPCGPDTEMFFDLTGGLVPKGGPSANSQRFVEIWNDVFMEYNKLEGDGFELLKQKNVDTGMGLERILMVLQGVKSVYETDVFAPLMVKLNQETKDVGKQDLRIVADHIKAAIFLIGDGIRPSNLDRGYVLRRLIRRAIIKGKWLEMGVNFEKLAAPIAKVYETVYSLPQGEAVGVLNEELDRFRQSMKTGYAATIKILEKSKKVISGQDAFYLFNSYGVPFDVTGELAKRFGKKVDADGFLAEFAKHREISRKGAGMFAGGLAEKSLEAAKLHTTTHLLHQALRDVLGTHVKQTGSHISSERLRFDFTHERKLTLQEIEKVEEIVNKQIEKKLEVKSQVIPLAQAQKLGAIGLFGEKYGEIVNVYFIGDYSREFCGGPHAKNTGELGRFKIIKEGAIGAARRRIYAKLEN